MRVNTNSLLLFRGPFKQLAQHAEHKFNLRFFTCQPAGYPS